MDDNSLQINIEAFDDASAVLEGVAEASTTMGETVAESALLANGALETMEESVAGLSEVMSVDSALISDEALGIGVSFDEAATMVTEASAEAEAAMAGMGIGAEEAATEGALSMGEFKSSLLQIGIVASIAFIALKKEIENASADSAEWQGTLAILNQELVNTKSAIPLAELVAYTRSMQDNTLFSQQAVLDAEKIVMAHKDLQAGYQKTVGLSADLATFMKTDLPTAANALATALDNPQQGINRLGREMGGPFSEAQVSAIEKMAKAGDIAAADALIFKTLEDSVGGAAEKVNDTAPFVKLNNELATLNRIIGDDLNKTLETFLPKIIPIIEKIEDWAAAHPKLVAGILLVSAAVAGIVVGLVGLGLVIAAVSTAVTAIGVIIGGVALGLIAVLAVAIGMLAVVWVEKWKDIEGGFEIVYNKIKIWFQDIMNWINEAKSALSGFGGNVAGGAGIVGGWINQVIPHFAEGGIVNGPTLALIGESGPEMIVPMNMIGGRSNSSPLPSFGGTGNNGSGINVYITGQVYSTEDQAKKLGDAIAKQINRQIKLTPFR